MEFLLIVVFAILSFVLVRKIGGLRIQTANLDRNLQSVGERLDGLTSQIATLSRHLTGSSDGAAPTDVEPLAAQPAQPTAEAIQTPVERTPSPPPSTEAPPIDLPPAASAEPMSEPLPDAGPNAAPEPISIAASQASPTAAVPGDASPPPSGSDLASLERRFGTQWVVWVGGLALALGGIFLVRYSIEQGFFGPGLRVMFGAVLALLLVVVGELARRRELTAGLVDLPIAHIPSILTAAGTTVAYADVYAAYALYDFLPPALAFLLLGLVALATLGAALVHGPALAGLGLIGAYVTPALVSANAPNYWVLYIYLAVVTAAAYALARVRLWRWLAVTAATLSILWLFAGITDPRAGSLTAHAFYAVAIFTLATVFLVAGLFEGPPARPGRFDPVCCGVLAGTLFGAFTLVIATAHAPLAIATLFVLTLAAVAIALRTETAILAMPAGAVLAILVVVHWAFDSWFVAIAHSDGPLSIVPIELLAGVGLHATFAAAIAALFVASGYFAQGRSEQPAFAMLWAATAVATPLVLLIALYYRVTQFERSILFAGVALLLALVLAMATEMLAKRDRRAGMSEAVAIFASGTVAALALALTFALEKGWLTVGLALMVPGIALIVERRPVPLLRKLCGGIAALVLARIGWDPRIVGDSVGTMPIFNWILYGYGVPAICFWAGGYLLRRTVDDVSSRSVDGAAILFTALTAFFEIRHLMNDGDIYRPAASLAELGLQISVGLAMTAGLEHLRVRSASVVHDWSARILAAGTFVAIFFGLLVGENPMLTGHAVGGPFFNYVLLGYGIPAVLMAVLARIVHNTRPQPYYVVAAVSATLLMLSYLTLEVRVLFQGPVLTRFMMSDAEDYTYSAVWLAFGVVLLLVGIVVKSLPARLASAAVVVLTIGKVFLHDLAGVQGIYRAFSFIGLGLVLIGIGWLYQRLLFPPRQAPPEPDSSVIQV